MRYSNPRLPHTTDGVSIMAGWWRCCSTKSSNVHIKEVVSSWEPITSIHYLIITNPRHHIPLSNCQRCSSQCYPNLQFITTPSGLQYADVKTGTSASPTDGQTVSIDYVMSTTGARYGSKIYSTQDAGAPYRWKLGDGSTIPGLEEAVRSMSPGGIRRVIIPSKLAYLSASSSISKLWWHHLSIICIVFESI